MRYGFLAWLNRQARRDDPIGDLAGDVKADRKERGTASAERGQWPSSPEALLRYLEEHGSQDAVRAYHSAMAEYRSSYLPSAAPSRSQREEDSFAEAADADMARRMSAEWDLGLSVRDAAQVLAEVIGANPERMEELKGAWPELWEACVAIIGVNARPKLPTGLQQ